MSPTEDRPALGILFMLGFCALAPLADALAKHLADTLPVLLLVCARFGVQAVALSPWMKKMPALNNRRFWGLSTLRAALHIAGIYLMMTALVYLPLADALAIAFVMPFIMLLLAKYVLHEAIGPQRLWATLVGFIGTLLVIQPNFVTVGWPALLPLGVAVIFALFMLVTRQIAKETDPITLQGLNGWQALVILSGVLLVTGDAGGWTWPDAGGTWALVLGIGLLGTLAHLLMTWSLRLAPSATLAPMQYLEIPFATLIGWLIFADLPNGLAALGILITLAAGLYIVWRENKA